MAVFGNNTQNNLRTVSEVPEKEVVQLKLNNGQDSEGNIKTVNQNLGSLDANAWDAQKVMNIAEALSPCLSKSITAVWHVRTTNLVD